MGRERMNLKEVFETIKTVIKAVLLLTALYDRDTYLLFNCFYCF